MKSTLANDHQYPSSQSHSATTGRAPLSPKHSTVPPFCGLTFTTNSIFIHRASTRPFLILCLLAFRNHYLNITRKLHPPYIRQHWLKHAFAEHTVDKTLSVNGLISPSLNLSDMTKLDNAYVYTGELIHLSPSPCTP